MHSNCSILKILLPVLLSLALYLPAPCQTLDSLSDSTGNYQYHLGWIWPPNDSFHVNSILPLQDQVFVINSKEGILFKLNDKAEIQWTFAGDSRTTLSPLVSDSIIYLPFQGNRYSAETNAIIAIDTLERFLGKYEFDDGLSNNPILSPDGSIYIETPVATFSDRLIRMTPDGKFANFEGTQDSSRDMSYNNLRIQGFDSTGNVIVYVPWEKSVRFIAPDGKVLKTYNTDGWPHIDSNRQNIIHCIVCFIGDTLTLALDAAGNQIWSQRGKKYIDGGIGSLKTSDNNSRLAIGTSTGKIYVLNAVDGSIVNLIDLGESFGSVDEMEWIKNDLVVASNSNNLLLILDTTGATQWKTSLYHDGAPVLQYISTGGDIYLTQSGRVLKYTTDSAQVTAIPDPAPLPQSKEEAENEIVQFMLDDICRQIKSLSEFQNDELDLQVQQLLKQTSSVPSLILFADAIKPKNEDMGDIKWKSLSKSWLYKNGEATPQENPEKAQRSYESKYVKDNRLFMPWTYEIYKFGILSLNADYTEAEIALDNYCGATCGHGSYLKLKRSPSGKWWTARYYSTWIS